MNLAATLSLFGGGPGSGCHGDDCGRPPGPGGVPLPLNQNPWVKPKKDWGSSKFSEKKVGGHFKAGSAIAQIYQKLADNEGQWHKKSDFKAQFPDIKNLDYRVQILKRRGKLTGKWSVEVSGDQIRLILTRQAEKTEAQVVQEEKNESRAQQLAKDFAALNKKYGGQVPAAESKALFADYYQHAGISASQKLAFENAVRGWTYSANDVNAQDWRAVAMKYYGRSPSDERVGGIGNPNRFLSGQALKKAEEFKDAALAMKDYAGAYAKSHGVTTVYRGISGPVAQDIWDAFKKGADAVEVPVNSLSSWSEKLSTAKNSFTGYKGIVLKMKVDSDNIWAVHDATPWLFSAHKHEKEYVVGMRKAKERFTRNDIECDGCL